MRIAKVQGAEQKPRRVTRVRRRAIGMREVHATQPDGGHGEQSKLSFCTGGASLLQITPFPGATSAEYSVTNGGSAPHRVLLP